MRKLTLFSMFILSAAALRAGEQPLQVFTTFYPLTYFTEQIGGAHVHVVNPLPEKEDGAFWVPPRDVVKQYQAADLIVMNGSNYEQGFGKVSLPESKTVVTTTFLKGNEVILEDPVTHAHGTTGMHTHQGMDGHTWVDPRTARKQAQIICDALCDKRPEFAAEFRANLAKLDKNFDGLEHALAETVVPSLQGKQILASHPAYNYLARSFGLKVKSFHLDPEEAAPAAEVAAIEKFIKDNPAKIILWEDTPSAGNEKLMREKFGLISVVFSPCENLSSEDARNGRSYFDVMKRNIASLSEAAKK